MMRVFVLRYFEERSAITDATSTSERTSLIPPEGGSAPSWSDSGFLKRRRSSCINGNSRYQTATSPPTSRTASLEIEPLPESVSSISTSHGLSDNNNNLAHPSSGNATGRWLQQSVGIDKEAEIDHIPILEIDTNRDAGQGLDKGSLDTSEEDLYGFQTLDLHECAMSSWTNASITRESLYVPPALGHLLQNMKRTLEAERKARLKAEARLLTVVLESAEDEKKRVSAEMKVEALERDILRLEKEKEAFMETAVAMVASAHRPVADEVSYQPVPDHARSRAASRSVPSLNSAQSSGSSLLDREREVRATSFDVDEPANGLPPPNESFVP